MIAAAIIHRTACRIACVFACALLPTATAHAADPPPAVSQAKDGKLAYVTDQHGDRIPDFSTAGYKGGGEPIPDVPIRIVVLRRDGDSTARIQAAIDHVSSLPPDKNGIRGAVLLAPGRHEVAGGLTIAASGVVLRG